MYYMHYSEKHRYFNTSSVHSMHHDNIGTTLPHSTLTGEKDFEQHVDTQVETHVDTQVDTRVDTQVDIQVHIQVDTQVDTHVY